MAVLVLFLHVLEVLQGCKLCTLGSRVGLRSLGALLRIRRFVEDEVRVFVVPYQFVEPLELLRVYFLDVHDDDRVLLSDAVVHVVSRLQLAGVAHRQACGNGQCGRERAQDRPGLGDDGQFFELAPAPEKRAVQRVRVVRAVLAVQVALVQLGADSAGRSLGYFLGVEVHKRQVLAVDDVSDDVAALDGDFCASRRVPQRPVAELFEAPADHLNRPGLVERRQLVDHVQHPALRQCDNREVHFLHLRQRLLVSDGLAGRRREHFGVVGN